MESPWWRSVRDRRLSGVHCTGPCWSVEHRSVHWLPTFRSMRRYCEGKCAPASKAGVASIDSLSAACCSVPVIISPLNCNVVACGSAWTELAQALMTAVPRCGRLTPRTNTASATGAGLDGQISDQNCHLLCAAPCMTWLKDGVVPVRMACD